MSKYARFMLASVGIIFINGCATNEPIPVVYDEPRIQLPPDPIPATNRITDHSTEGEIMKSWVSTAMDYRGWNIAVRQLIENSR